MSLTTRRGNDCLLLSALICKFAFIYFYEAKLTNLVIIIREVSIRSKKDFLMSR